MMQARLNTVAIGSKRYSTQFQTEAQFQAAWQRVLAAAYHDHRIGNCLCRAGGERPLYIRHHGERFILAKYPDTGASHAPDCHYYAAEADPDATPTAQRPEEEPADGAIEVRLAFGMRVKSEEKASEPSVSIRARRRAASGRVLPLAELVRLLWDEAELNEWRPEWAGKRTLFTINRRLLERARWVLVNGAALSEHLLLGAVKNDAAGVQRNADLLAQASQHNQRLLLVARMAAPLESEPPVEMLRVVNFHGLPKVFVAREAAATAQKAQANELALWKAGNPTMVMAQIEPVTGKPYWRAVDLAWLAVTRDYVAAS